MYLIYKTVKDMSKKAQRISFSNVQLNFKDSGGRVNGEDSELPTSLQLRQKPKSKYARRVKQTAIQAGLYVAAYIVTHAMAFIVSLLDQFVGEVHGRY